MLPPQCKYNIKCLNNSSPTQYLSKCNHCNSAHIISTYSDFISALYIQLSNNSATQYLNNNATEMILRFLLALPFAGTADAPRVNAQVAYPLNRTFLLVAKHVFILKLSV